MKYPYGALVPPPTGPDYTDVQFVSEIYQSFVAAVLSGHFDVDLPIGADKGFLRSRPNGDDIELVLHDGVTEKLLATYKAASGDFELAPDRLLVGSVSYFAMTTAPTGWLKANGAALSRTTYADLFAAIGTTYGAGDGTTTFNLPDLRGEFLRGWDDGRGIDAGRAFGSGQTDAFQGHKIKVTKNSVGQSAEISESAGSSGTGYVAQGSNSTNTTVVLVADTFISDGVNGTPRIAAETRARNVALLPCIKY